MYKHGVSKKKDERTKKKELQPTKVEVDDDLLVEMEWVGDLCRERPRWKWKIYSQNQNPQQMINWYATKL
jgi:hypothetical protein